MEALKDWWNNATSREQLYLLVGGICVAICLVYVILYKPITGMRDKQLRINNAQLASLERVRELAGQVQALNNTSDANTGPRIDQLVQRSLSANLLRAAALDASGRNGVRIRLENAPFDRVVAWLHELEITQGVQIKDLTVAAGKQQGQVTINMRVQKG